jgi:hypothetical protein
VPECWIRTSAGAMKWANTWTQMEKPAERLALSGFSVLVAGAGFEPTTFGL